MTMEIWLAPLASAGAAAALILMGYWMGRNSAELPMRSDNNPRVIDQGSSDDPGGDPYEDAMTEVATEDTRIDTMR